MSKEFLGQAQLYYKLGFAIHWLHPKSKRPIESGWNTGPRKDWSYLAKMYHSGMNVGVRLGEASKIEGHFLGALDVDVKSTDVRHAKAAMAKARDLLQGHRVPVVESGRGNGSRHFYILTKNPLKPLKIIQSTEVVKVHMPSARPSNRELKALATIELEDGLRLRPAWEIAAMGEGQQVVLPPSVHPDSGRLYRWRVDFNSSLAMSFDSSTLSSSSSLENQTGNHYRKEMPSPRAERDALNDFQVEEVDINRLAIGGKIEQMLLVGENVSDRSAALLPVATALLRGGLSRNQILSVLTDRSTFLGKCAYDHAHTQDRSKAAQWVWRYTLRRVTHESAAENIFISPIQEVPPVLSAKEIEENEAAFRDTEDWKSQLDRTKELKIRPTLRNVVLILENEVARNMVQRDLFSIRDFYSIHTPWGGAMGRPVDDDSTKQIKHWISINFGCEPSTNVIGEALTIIAMRNAFDPVADWLASLPPWDEVSRLDTWLKNHFQAEGDEDYLAQIFRKWMVAMVMRILHPGAKFDWMPIFEGAQGIGKSSFGRLICGEQYFLDWLPELSNKDAALALQGNWCVEMSELASLRKSEIGAVKSFITRTVDKVRPPYGQRWLETPRRCVFFGTTNLDEYLRDDSGNRRFKPVKVGQLDFERLESERVQLFAEALWLFKSGFETGRTLEIDGAAKIYEHAIQKEKMVPDDSALMLDSLRHFIEKESSKAPPERFNFSKFKIASLFVFDGDQPILNPPLANWKYETRHTMLAAKALGQLGAKKIKAPNGNWWRIELGPND